MSVFNNLKQTYKSGSVPIRLIFVNVAIYLIFQALIIIMRLFNIEASGIINLFALPAVLPELVLKPWSLITYMFLHQDFFHILFNMLTLYWFGKLFQMYFTDKQLVSLYFLGGISAGITYILAYNLFPYFQDLKQISILMGASGSILAIILATAIQAPNLEMRLLLIGAVKLKYIAAAVVVMSFFGITSHNAGGDIAHLGGALFGYFFVVSLRNGRDITRFFNRVMDFFIDLFKPRRLKVKHTQSQKRKMSDAEYNMHKASTMTEIDRILDKIKASGYGSLTDEEKRKLFEQSKK